MLVIQPEAVDAGTVKLVGTSYDRIIDNVSTLLTDKRTYTAMAHHTMMDMPVKEFLRRSVKNYDITDVYTKQIKHHLAGKDPAI